MKIQRKILFFGDVQGVGFRYTTFNVAKSYSVTGFVRNRPNGSVELIAEGESREIDHFLAAVRDRLCNHIDREETSESPATDEFNGFRIAY